ncbi:GNAT family N-acetyltransferase [Methanosarcina sp. KYL-1]|uniref:GNAT family N-acetyltransferase n=1 Tax=Methanosarcina sp. KYL-1 TaxID=2602068 RepID=UPI0021017749|nr:GNAT family N-acetyltransferase [Methanosarcina sp. KYL-1]MCQ1536867.1 GNAT family N-acetyltransferase [Methanosarcina sp. KYL-1]
MNTEKERIDIFFREAEIEDHPQIQAFIELVDPEFYPPLSERPGGIDGRIENSLAKPDANFLIAEGSSNSEPGPVSVSHPDRTAGPDRIAGLISYERQWEGENNAYISFVAVNPEFRNLGIASKLISLLEEQMQSAGMERMYVCTWSTNHSALALYEKKGFSTDRVIKNARGPFVDTLYLVKSIG